MISTPVWFLLVGGLLLFMALTTSRLKSLPITSAIIYLAVGLIVGPTVLNVFHFNPLKQSALLEVLTEVAVLISLFAPVLLATVSMAATVAMVAAFAYYLLGMPLGACIILGAILAPTDPVLATDVQIRHPGDQDQLRFTLTCEAGMNDGSAFPFVMLGMGLLGLHEVGETGLRWLLVDVLWATLAGIAVGVVGGYLLARLAWNIRGPQQDRELLDDFLGLGLIGAVYGISVLIGAWGFLAVFFAAVALHQTELKLAGRTETSPELPPALVSSADQRRFAGLQGAPGAPVRSGADPTCRRHAVRRLVELAGGRLRPVHLRHCPAA